MDIKTKFEIGQEVYVSFGAMMLHRTIASIHIHATKNDWGDVIQRISYHIDGFTNGFRESSVFAIDEPIEVAR